MGTRPDDFGLIWTTPPKVKAGPSLMGPMPGAIAKLPKGLWTAPTEFMRLDGVARLSLDLECRDEELSEYGPGVRRDPNAYVVGIAIGTDDGRRQYYPMRHEGGGNMDPERVLRWARDELNKFDGELVGGNIIYDLDWMGKEKVTFHNIKAVHDIQIAEPLLDEWRFSYSVENISEYYLGEGKNEELFRRACHAYGYGPEPTVEGQAANRQRKTNLWRLPAEYVGAYAEGDVDLPLRVLELQLKKLEEENLMPVYTMERKLIPMMLAMRQRGVKIDLAKAERVRDALVIKRKGVLAKFKHLCGNQAEFRAPMSFAKALQERGLVIPLTPKNKQPSITKGFLEKHKGDEACATALEGRKIDTIINTFMEGHILGHHVNGRIHCEFHQLKGEDGGTIARFSSSNPNLQNIPARDEELAPLIRSCFIPEDGETWERLDESQVEYRLLVNFARGQGAEEARQNYITNPKTDYHKLVAVMLGVDPDDSFKRKRVKNVNFARVYGAQAPRFAETWGCSLQEAQKLIEEYDSKLPFVKATYDAAAKWANKRGFVVTILDRKQRFPFWEPFGNYGENAVPPLPRDQALTKYGSRIKRAWCYMGLSRKLQGSAAEIMKKAMVDSWESGVWKVLGAPLLTVHDELDISKPCTKAGEEAVREAQHTMANCVTLKVPLICDRESGPNWGELS